MMRKTKKGRHYADQDKLRYMVVTALEYYQEGLNSLLDNKELVPTETDMFENYLEKAANEAGDTADQLRQNTRLITTVVKEDSRYWTIVKEALTYYINGLEKSKRIIREKLGARNSTSKSILLYYNEQISHAKELKQWINEARKEVAATETLR